MEDKFRLLSDLEYWIQDLLYNNPPSTESWLDEVTYVPDDLETVHDDRLKLVCDNLYQELIATKLYYNRKIEDGPKRTEQRKNPFNKYDKKQPAPKEPVKEEKINEI